MKNMDDIIWIDTVDSTNLEARRRLEHLDNLSVLTALSQTSGRGQRGNSWSSDKGKNLLFSIVLKFGRRYSRMIQAYDQFCISELAALSVVEFLSGCGIAAKIKWPNDIYVGDRKIGGILIENSLSGEWISSSIIGIGLNINQREFDKSLPNPTSLILETKADTEYDIEKCIRTFNEIFHRYHERYLNISGGFPALRRLYLAQMWRIDEEHRFIDNTTGRTFIGRIIGLSDVGQLMVEIEKGELKEFAFKEISYIIP